MTSAEQISIQVPEENRPPVAWKVTVVTNESRSVTVIFPQATALETAESKPVGETVTG